jgi:hypothetical protein
VAEQITPEQIAEQLRRLRVADLLVAETTTLAQIAYAKLGERDVDQARLAIDALRALVPILAGAIPEQAHRDLQQVVTNLQLAFASVAAQPKEEASSPPEQEKPEEPADDADG